ncbi:protein eva-1 C, partial [Trichonephila inaurata madagascariensis]
MDLSVRIEISLLLAYLFFQFISLSLASDNYEKWHRTLFPFQSHACDDEELHLHCTSNTVISIHYVFYGRQVNAGHLCAHKNTIYVPKSCESSKALQVIHERCHKNRMCRLFISPKTFRDDPCPGVRKFIEVMYKCRPDCLIDHADETIRSICAGKQNCSLKAEDRTFGNPGCKGKKHLKVAYNC